jgi:hypothetical protein
MQAFVAVRAADRISHTAILLAGVLCGVLVFFVAVPLALSSPYPSPKEGSWIIHRSGMMHVASAISPPIREELPAELSHQASAISWNLVSLPAYDGPALFVPAEPTKPAQVAEPEVTYSIASASSTEVRLDPRPAPMPVLGPAPATRPVEPAKRSNAGTVDEVNDYLWEVYQRAPVKKDGAGDFTWKDPIAAKRMGMSMPTYVIGGMDPDFREQLYHAGRAMDEAGIRWSMLSAFRDDYRQSLAAGIKAGNSNSLHGGKARTGGYGHGQATDISNVNGNDETVWRWIDRNGAKYGLYRPMPGYDPAHIQPREAWHKIAANFRANRVRLAEENNAAGTKTAAAGSKDAAAKAQ